ncbi:Mothers against decapentaplegic -like protein 6 [Takifugu flavidus]|uniref:Mothers against decapentaplegic-like protein 6 n=1 Tax=Takifugu flavidus TaxID=433684 RepID=A0A5C6P7T5_9TELE|nr:Mothers against decapentaplegic -like protein 6 [Takifugu flavidus]
MRISVLFPADLSDSTLSYTETEAASSPNITPGEFSGQAGSPRIGSLATQPGHVNKKRPVRYWVMFSCAVS